MQRLRVRFSRGEELKFISHLDIMRLLERALTRASIPLAYSEGFSPHPRMSLAAPLALGVTSESELMDIYLDRHASPQWFRSAISQQLPRGMEVLGVYQVPEGVPSLQAQVRFAEYVVEVEGEKSQEDVRAAITGLLACESLPWHHQRDTGERKYDLRTLIEDIWLMGQCDQCYSIGMRLRCDSRGSGRPEQLTLALGFARHPVSIHRTRLILGT